MNLSVSDLTSAVQSVGDLIKVMEVNLAGAVLLILAMLGVIFGVVAWKHSWPTAHPDDPPPKRLGSKKR